MCFRKPLSVGQPSVHTKNTNKSPPVEYLVETFGFSHAERSQMLVELGDLSLHQHYTSVDIHLSLYTSSDLLYSDPSNPIPSQTCSIQSHRTLYHLRPALYSPIVP